MSAAHGLPADFSAFARRIQAAIRAQSSRWRDSEQIGPFLATFNPDDANPFLNYAVPDDCAEPTRADVNTLVAAYRKRGRRPRLEYIPAVAPGVEPVLLECGFRVEARLPLMTCASVDHVREVVVGDVEIVAPASEDEYRAAALVQWEAYEEEGDVPQRAVDSLRRTLDAGGVVALARAASTGESAGAGACTAPDDGLTELTSVGVREKFRRRGIAAAMTAWLAKQAFSRGAAGIFLMAHSDREARIYARAGFASCGEVLHISRE